MIIDGITLEPKQTVYLWKQGQAGMSVTPVRVEEINEPIKAVKVMKFIGSEENRKGKTEWVSASLLRRVDKKQAREAELAAAEKQRLAEKEKAT